MIKPLADLKAMIRASGRVGARDNPVAAVMWVVVSTAILAGLAAFAKHVALDGVHPFQIVFLRNAVCLALLMPLLAWRGPGLARGARPALYGMRVGVSLVSMMLWFSALAVIPLGELQAIAFLTPLFATVFAMALLGERVLAQRWIALAVGLAGALIILRPWHLGIGLGQMLALLAAVTVGLTGPLIKQLTVRDDPDKIVFITHLWLTPLSLVPALLVWSWPPVVLWPYLIGLGVCAFLGHLALVRAFNSADASFVAAFEFLRLPFAVAIGTLWFGETTDLWTWAGATVIFLAAVFVARHEAGRADRATQEQGRNDERQ